MPIGAHKLIGTTGLHNRLWAILLIAVIPTIVFAIANPGLHNASSCVIAMEQNGFVAIALRTIHFVRSIGTIGIVIATILLENTLTRITAEMIFRAIANCFIFALIALLNTITRLICWNAPVIVTLKVATGTRPSAAINY